MVLLTNLESFTLNKSVVSLTSLEFTRGTASKMISIAARLPKIAFPSDTLAVNTIDQFDLCAGRSFSPKLNSIAARLPKIAIPSDTVAIVSVQYFVRGGFVGHRSRASSKHLSPHLPVDELDSSGVKKGLRCRSKMHVWVSCPQRNRLDVGVFEK
ncbi:hypothetical protein TNCV_2455691 [Trichonephila clavipes]|nr:hypothetical protein TNCV_2455691 [Trichonephila clavipes]